MNYYCTLFDSNYLTRGLAMYESLRIHSKQKFHLYILAFDEEARAILTKLELPDVTVISLHEFEDERMKAIKASRSRREYCWTCASVLLLYVLNHYKMIELTYLDSDIYFFSDPQILLDEFHVSGKDVMITRHNYTPKYDQSTTSGIYCVQFVTFKLNDNGILVLKWWTDRCEEWCGENYKDGKFGDQKYLDDWPRRFDGVYVLKNPSGGVAPWNVQQYKIDNGPTIDGEPIVFYHFHALRLMPHIAWQHVGYEVSSLVLKYVYKPYLGCLYKKLDLLRSEMDHDFNRGFYKTSLYDLYNVDSKDKAYKKAVIYGAGLFGRATYAALYYLDEYIIVGWLDRDAERLQEQGLPVDGTVQLLNNLDYDVLFLAIDDKDGFAKKMLMDFGVPGDKVVLLKQGAKS